MGDDLSEDNIRASDHSTSRVVGYMTALLP